jgi:hypothetical protein
MLKGRDQLVAATAVQAGLNVNFAPYLFETCVDETWQLDRFPTCREKSRMKRQMDLSNLESALPVRGESSEKVGDFGVTWLEPSPSSSSGVVLRDSNTESSSELPAAVSTAGRADCGSQASAAGSGATRTTSAVG